VAHGRKPAGQCQTGFDRGRRNLRLGWTETICGEDAKRQQGYL